MKYFSLIILITIGCSNTNETKPSHKSADKAKQHYLNAATYLKSSDVDSVEKAFLHLDSCVYYCPEGNPMLEQAKSFIKEKESILQSRRENMEVEKLLKESGK